MKPVDVSLENVKGVLLDLDNTLYVYEPCNLAGMVACAHLAKVKYGLEEAAFNLAWKNSREKVHELLPTQAAGHSRLLYAQLASEIIFDTTNAEFALEMETTYWSTFMQNMVWEQPMLSLLELLKTRNIPICLVTDLTAQIQLQKWIKLELHRFVQFMVSSEEAGIEKPYPTMFELAMAKLKLTNEEVIMIGDSQKKDIFGARQLDIKCYLYKEGELHIA